MGRRGYRGTGLGGLGLLGLWVGGLVESLYGHRAGWVRAPRAIGRRFGVKYRGYRCTRLGGLWLCWCLARSYLAGRATG
ncbi:hypothetical protein M569_12910 [Genlisea aurea]|uniref:Uncharacterized protein n=1 Tax=Genlisea aurea TaxID=192259 RepID=S8DGJ0_9LAMI|nr:hypothetical protein M569_12910 [Genlisea aurea]